MTKDMAYSAITRTDPGSPAPRARRRTWLASFTLLCCALLGASCGGAGDAPDDDEDVEIGSRTAALAEGRPVQVVPAAMLPSYEIGSSASVDPRDAVRGVTWAYAPGQITKNSLSWLDLVIASCDIPVRSLYGDPGTNATRRFPTGQLESGVFLKQNGAAAFPSGLAGKFPSPLGEWTDQYSDRPWLSQALLLCAGQKSLELAQALSSRYAVGYFPDGNSVAKWIVLAESESAWPSSWQKHQQLLRSINNTKSFSLPAWDSKFKTLFEIPAPNAEQAATWSLLAVDFFRESALVGAWGLDQYRTQNTDDLTKWVGELADGKRLSLREVVVGHLSDAVTGMEEASQRAQLYVAAATSADRETERNRVQDWRGRFGSRLEAARVFAAIDPTLFEMRGLVPLYSLTSAGTGANGATVAKKTVITTNVKEFEAAWAETSDSVASRVVIGYVYPSYLPQPEGTDKLVRRNSGATYWTAPASLHSGTTCVPPSGTGTCTDAQKAVWQNPTLEGYVPFMSNKAPMLELTFSGNAVANFKLEVGKTQNPTNVTGPAVFGKLVRSTANNADTFNVNDPELTGGYPVVTALSKSNRDRIAEKTLRNLRVSPVKCPNDVCTTSQLRPTMEIANDMAKAEAARTFLKNFYADGQKYLDAPAPFNKDELHRAARRLAQEAEVLGHPITIDKDGSLDNGMVKLVNGTRKDLRPVETAYLQARTDGFARFASEGLSSELDVEFARRGMYQAALYVRQALDRNSAVLPSVTDTQNKLKAWLDSLTSGYVRVVMSRDTKDSKTVAALDVRVLETQPSPGVYELWVGEDALECALHGTISGLTCKASDYRVVSYDFTATTATEVQISSTSPATKIVDAKLALGPGRRVYLTKNAGAKRVAVAGFTLPQTFATKVVNSATTYVDEWRRLPLLSSAVAQAYSDTLAADPNDSYRAEKFCNGLIDYDMRIKVGESSTGESSLDHALGNARTAAKRADDLAADVIASGLEMDERAERAADDLEDLCGVTVDVGSLPIGSPSGDEVEDPLNVPPDSEGYDACMAGPDKLTWVSVGTSAHCAWRLPGKEPCSCGGDAACVEWVKKNAAAGNELAACPISPAIVNAKGTFTKPLRQDDDTLANDDGPDQAGLDQGCQDFFATYKDDAAKKLPSSLEAFALTPAGNAVDTGSLGELPVEEILGTPPKPEGWNDAATRCELLAALYAGDYKNMSEGDMRRAFAWLDYDTVRDIAASIGVSIDPFGRYQLTLEGEPWLKVGSLKPLPFGDEGGPLDRRFWPGSTEGWPVSALAHDLCSTDEAKENFLYCRGLDGGENHADRIEDALETLQHLAGAIGPRDDWEWTDDAEYVGATKQYVTDTVQIYSDDPDFRNWAFPCKKVGNNTVCQPFNDVFMAVRDDVKIVATDIGVLNGTPLYPIPDISYDGKSYRQWAAPHNWIGAAAFSAVHDDAIIDDKFDADEFVSNSTLWQVLKDPNAKNAHTAIEWTYHPPKKRSRWQKFKDAMSNLVVLDTLTGGALFPIAGAFPNYPIVATGSAINMGNRIINRSRGKWTKDEWPVTRQGAFDAFSLVCMAMDERDGLRPLDQFDGVKSVSSLSECKSYFPEEPTLRDAGNAADCVARKIALQIDEMYVPHVPNQLLPTIKQNGEELVQVVPAFAGEYAEAVANLNADIEIYRASTAAMSRAMNELAYHTRTLGRAVNRLRNELQINELDLFKEIANQATACAVAGASAAGMNPVEVAGKGAAAAATCANMVVQIMWSSEIANLRAENIAEEELQTIDDFNQSIENVLSRLDEQMVATRQAHSRIHGTIAKMDGIRAKAQRAHARASLAWDLGNGRVNHVNAVMRARMNTNMFRYDEAWRQAVRYGFIARKAVEQTYGEELDTMTHRMSLFGKSGAGQAPYEWADTICYKRGIDYERIRDGKDGSINGTGMASADSEQGYADSYISDYVTKLEDFVESYNVDFPYTEGADIAVVSMRDELKGVRKLDCAVEGPNYLYNSAAPDSVHGSWLCGDVNCASFNVTDAHGSPLGCSNAECETWQTGIRAAKLTPVLATLPTTTKFDVPKSLVAQDVSVDAGNYVLSYYEKCIPATTAPNAPMLTAAVRAFWTEPTFGAAKPAKPVELNACSCTNQNACQKGEIVKLPIANNKFDVWVRRWGKVRFNQAGLGRVALELDAKAQAEKSKLPYAVLSAPQLEPGLAPTQYFPTDNDGVAPVGICEDTDGKNFRAVWVPGCEHYCPAGYGLDCAQRIPEEDLPEACFYEANFSISQEDIERGMLITEAGFAKGNFNYRIDSIALNFVGTNLKSCAGSQLSSACNAGQFLQYSIDQSGSYRVRNYEGDLVGAPLFPGKIQMAKGLTAERYLTNPISTGDEALISTYWRKELNERPLDGEYKIRVYQTEGLQWHHLEDIQIVLKYDDWTRTRPE
jgi:hypothetical protein